MGVRGTYRRHLILGAEDGEGTHMPTLWEQGLLDVNHWVDGQRHLLVLEPVTARLLQLFAHFQADN